MPKALPENDQAEAFVLGSVLLNDAVFVQVSGMLDAGDFAREAHRRIFSRMKDLHERGEKIDRVTVANELLKQGQIESVGGFQYLVSLDEGLPGSINLDSYIKIVKDNRDLRALAFLAQYLEQQVQSRIAPLDLVSDIHSRLTDIERGAMVMDNVPKMDVEVDEMGGILEIINPTTVNPSIKTGWKRFDAMATGLELGTLTIIAGRPGMGKSAAMMCLLQNIAEAGTPVAVFSMEMSRRSLLDRMICVKGQVDFAKYRTRSLGPTALDDARRALEHIYDLPIYIDDKEAHTIGELSRKIDRLVGKHGVKVVALDYAQLLTRVARQQKGGEKRTTTEVLGEAVEGLKGIAKRLNIAFVLLSQLSRDLEKRGGMHKPMLSDLRDSGALEQVADIVAFVWREVVYKPESSHLVNAMELIISKQRNGPCGSIPMRFDGSVGGLVEDV